MNSVLPSSAPGRQRPWLMMRAASAASISGPLATVCVLRVPGPGIVLAAFAVIAVAGWVFSVWNIVQLQHRWNAADRALESHERQAAEEAHERQEAAKLAEQQQSARLAEHAQKHHRQLQQQMKAFYGSVKQLLESRLPAAWAGEEVPDSLWPDELDEGVREALKTLFDQAVQAAQETRGQWEHDAESMRLAVVAVAQRAQTAAHRVAAAADQLSEKTSDPEVLERFIQVSHTAAQQARHAQSLQVLCGEPTGQQWPRPLAVVDVVRAASGRITDYRRVEVAGNLDLAVQAPAVEPLIHVIAELLANAAQSSPPATKVMVHVQETQHGVAVRVDDSGVGLTEHELAELRPIASGERLVELWQVGEVPRIGLAVVGTLARRLDLQVSLQSSPYGGVQAVVLILRRLVSTLAPGAPSAAAPAPQAPATTASGLPVRGRRRKDPDDTAAIAAVPTAPVRTPDPDPVEAGALLDGLITSTATPSPEEER